MPKSCRTIRIPRTGSRADSLARLGVALSRVALGAHWPPDVIVSPLIGASWLLGAEQMLTSSWVSSRCSTLGLHRRHSYDGG
ncbi:MAG: phosphatase PAP2 family protein [Acidimicrobiia bacterium]